MQDDHTNQPHHNGADPQDSAAPGPPASTAENGAPHEVASQQEGEPSVLSVTDASQVPDFTVTPISPPAEPETPEEKPRTLIRRGRWTAIALLCVAGGALGSILGARAVAHTDASSAPASFRGASLAIASNVRQAIQHEEDLALSASTFFAGSPNASRAEFADWVRWVRVLRRYPELESLGFVTVVPAPELAAFQARLAGRPLKPSSVGLPAALPAQRVTPASAHHYYCLTAVELARSAAVASPASLDYCAQSSAPLLARRAGLSTYTPVSLGSSRALEVQVPVYRGSAPPASPAGRLAASVGWLREVFIPGLVLQQALRGNPGYGVLVRYPGGSSAQLLAGPTPRAVAQSAVVSLHDGWSVTSYGPPVGGSVLDDGKALIVLIAGCLLSALLGLVVFLLGARRAPPSPAPTPEPSAGSEVDLYDALTGLPNRALTLDRAGRMVARSSRESGLLAGALFVDIDRLKDINDKLGQKAGDQLVRIVGERLVGVVREHDTVGRLGGDEFVVLVESAARGVRLDSLARRMIEALHKPIELDGFGPSFVLTASIGVAFGRYATPQDMLRDAHMALAAAKSAGKDRYTLFNANMRTVIEGRSVLEAELNTALQERQFFLLYQPIYDLTSRRVVELEALIRWRHPKQGVLAPEDFIPLAEDTGLIVPLGRWALEEAASRAAAWNVAGHRVGVSVKVSPQQLNRDGFATDVRRALQQSGIEPSSLTLEITEGTVMRDVDAAAARLEEIKQQGVRLAIEDFGGGGYAYHSDLRRMPLDALRVDRGSLAASEDEEYRSWLLEAILIVGRELSLAVIATGIETEEQMSSLQVIGCTMAQGIHLGEPVPLSEAETLFDRELPVLDAAPAAVSEPSSRTPR